MFGFRRKASSSEPPGEKDRLATLSGRLDDVEASHRKLLAEWLDTYERLNRLVGRLVKRAERDALAREPDDTPGPQPLASHPLTPGAPGANGVSYVAEMVAKRRGRWGGSR